MEIHPKRFVAVKSFTIGSRSYEPGDPVEGVDLRTVLQFGDEFVVSEVAARRVEKTAKVEPGTETPEG